MIFKNGVVVCLAVGTTVFHAVFLLSREKKAVKGVILQTVLQARQHQFKQNFAGKTLVRLEGTSRGLDLSCLSHSFGSLFTVCWIEVKAFF
jgi:hypothetical protein